MEKNMKKIHLVYGKDLKKIQVFCGKEYEENPLILWERIWRNSTYFVENNMRKIHFISTTQKRKSCLHIYTKLTSTLFALICRGKMFELCQIYLATQSSRQAGVSCHGARERYWRVGAFFCTLSLNFFLVWLPRAIVYLLAAVLVATSQPDYRHYPATRRSSPSFEVRVKRWTRWVIWGPRALFAETWSQMEG